MSEPVPKQEASPAGFARGARVRISLGLLVSILFVGCFFATAGDVGWTRGWLYLGVLTAGHAVINILVARKNPELVRRRGEFGEGTKRWDFVVLAVFGLTFLATLFTAACDVRNGWSAMASPGWWLGGLILFCVYVVLLSWSMMVNPHFEKTVRIQEDRNHVVVDCGPYRVVRHPGYVGTVFGMILSAPLLLGSWWAFIPAAASGLSLIVRTALEDRTLRAELPGYEDYVRRVRYRFLPGVW